MSSSLQSRLIGLVVAGLASAILCLAVGAFALYLLAPGAIFGIAVIIAVAVRGGAVPSARWLLFVCACSAAYPLALLAGVATDDLLRTHTRAALQSGELSALTLFVGGFVGAAVVLLCGAVFIGATAARGRVLGAALLGALAGGGLGAVGGVLGPLDVGIFPDPVSLAYLLWQPGVALLLGVLLEWQKPWVEAAATDRSGPAGGARGVGRQILVGVVIAGVLATLGLFAFRGIHSYWEQPRMDSRYETLSKKRPSLTGLTAPEPIPADKLCIMEDIAGQRPLAAEFAGWNFVPLAPPFALTASCNYSVMDPGAPAGVGHTEVEIIRFPNADWAQYAVKVAVVNLGAKDPQSAPIVTKGRYPVTQIAAPPGQVPNHVPIRYLWASRSVFVMVTYDTTRNTEPVLLRYLEKYPSNS